MMAGLSSTIDSTDPQEIDRIIRDGIPDPVGTFLSFRAGCQPPPPREANQQQWRGVQAMTIITFSGRQYVGRESKP